MYTYYSWLKNLDSESEAKEKCKLAEDTSNVDELYLNNHTRYINFQDFI